MLVERVCASPQFRKAARMRELFQFLANRSIASPGVEITEYEIAAGVFGRGEGFDPSESNIVRVGVRQLRAKLKEYFDEAGAAENWVIDFPKGGYELRFVARASVVTVAAETANGMEFPWKRLAAALGVLVVLLGAALVWTLMASGGTVRQRPLGFLPRLVQTFEGAVQVVAADSAHVLMRHIATPAGVEDYESGQYTRAVSPEEFPPKFQRLWKSLQTRQLLNMADVNIAYRLAEDLHPKPPLLSMAKHLKARDFRAGNFVILGSGTSNPWHWLFKDQLNFYFEEETREAARIRNRKPKPGEPEAIVALQPQGNESYGIVALVQNLTATGKVLLIAGFSMEATEACGDFVLKPENRQKLMEAMGVSSEAALEGFELVLKTSAVSGTGRTAEIVAARATVAGR